jgi:phosphoribosylanthranilate isomerase
MFLFKKVEKKSQPFGIDVCSGVRTNGNLAKEKLTTFFKAVGY